MRLLIDGDACPKIGVLEKIAFDHNIETLVYCDNNHELELNYGSLISVEQGYQSVDIKLTEDVLKTDIVITSDYGLMIMVIGRGAVAIDVKGNVYDENKIHELILKKETIFYNKKNKLKWKASAKRTKADDVKLFTALHLILNQNN